MADQSTPPGQKQQFYGLQGQMWVALHHKIWAHVTAVEGDSRQIVKEQHTYCFCVRAEILSSHVFLLT